MQLLRSTLPGLKTGAILRGSVPALDPDLAPHKPVFSLELKEMAVESTRPDSVPATRPGKPSDATAGIPALTRAESGMPLDNVAVHRHHQGKGYGPRLLERKEFEARNHSCACLELYRRH